MKGFRGSPPKTERNLKLKELRSKGMSLNKLADHFAISEARVCQLLYGQNRRYRYFKFEGVEK